MGLTGSCPLSGLSWILTLVSPFLGIYDVDDSGLHNWQNLSGDRQGTVRWRESQAQTS